MATLSNRPVTRDLLCDRVEVRLEVIQLLSLYLQESQKDAEFLFVIEGMGPSEPLFLVPLRIWELIDALIDLSGEIVNGATAWVSSALSHSVS